MASNLRVDTILPSTGLTLGIGTASGTINFLGNSNIVTTGNVSIGGTLTYEDVTNVDSVGVITARSGIDAPSNLLLKTGGTERLRITSDGKIGINNDTPIHAVHIKSVMASSPSYIHMQATGSNVNGGGGGISFDTSAANTNEGLYKATIAGIRNTQGNGSNDLVFSTTDQAINGAAPTEKIRIGSKGQLGIGGANYGSSGQVLTSQGSGSAVQWASAGITQYDIWRITANLALQTSGTIISANWERADDATATYIGNGMSQSSGVFTFPVTGKWEIRVDACLNSGDGEMHYGQVDVMISSDSGSSYDRVSRGLGGCTSGGSYGNLSTTCLIDVTNASTFRCKFDALASNNNQSYLVGNTGFNYSEFIFKRIADT